MNDREGIISSAMPARVMELFQAKLDGEDVDRNIEWILGSLFNSALTAASFGHLSARVCGFSMEGREAVCIQVERVIMVEGIRERLLRALGPECQFVVESDTKMDLVVPLDQFQLVASRAESVAAQFYYEQGRDERP